MFRLDPDLHARLEECSKRVRLKKYQLAIMAMEAAVEAIEDHDYKIVLPIKFRVRDASFPAGQKVDYAKVERVLRKLLEHVEAGGDLPSATPQSVQEPQPHSNPPGGPRSHKRS